MTTNLQKKIICLALSTLVLHCDFDAQRGTDATRQPEPRDGSATFAEKSPSLDGGTRNDGFVEAQPKGREVVIAASGDVMIHRRVLESAQAHNDGFRGILAPLGRAITEARGSGKRGVVTLLNQETPLTERYAPPENTNPPVLGSPPELARDFRHIGIDVLNFANNHAYDQTIAGLVDSLVTAQATGLGTVGAGLDNEAALAPWITEREGLRIGFLGAAGHVNGGSGRGSKVIAKVAHLRNRDSFLAALKNLRKEVDVVALAIHWSHDFVSQPLKNQREFARELVDAGADLIFGTGPHVLQEVERLPSPRGQALVAYSLGNVISNQGLRYTAGHRIGPHEHPVAITPGTRDVVLFAVDVRCPDPGRVELQNPRAYAFWTHNNFWQRRGKDDAPADIRLVRLRDVEEELRVERLEAIRNSLGSNVDVIP